MDETKRGHDLPVSGGEIGTALKVASAVKKRFGRPPPVAVLRYREKIRNEIRQKLEWPKGDNVPEVLVIRLSKMDEYPSTDSPLFGLFSASPWNKFEVKRVHDRGLEVYVRIEYVTIARGKARRTPLNEPQPDDARKVWVVGRIPYERIAHIDWEPDPVYSAPRLYVDYGWRGPFRQVALYEEYGWDVEPPSGARRPHDYNLIEVHDVKYQGEAGTPWRWLRYTASRLRFVREDRQQRRRDRAAG